METAAKDALGRDDLHAIAPLVRAVHALAGSGQAGLLIGREHFVRLDASEVSKRVAMDDFARAVTEMPPIARALVEAAGHRVESMFLARAVPELQYAANRESLLAPKVLTSVLTGSWRDQFMHSE